MLHLGGDYIVYQKNIILILDYKKAVLNPDTSLFLKALERGSQAVIIHPERSETVVITEQQGEKKVYYSPIKSGTLLKRAIKQKGIVQ